MKLRSLLFWSHLIGGVTAGLVILIMSLTGALLTYERQWDRVVRPGVPSGAGR